jgi:hypothetical protein
VIPNRPTNLLTPLARIAVKSRRATSVFTVTYVLSIQTNAGGVGLPSGR